MSGRKSQQDLEDLTRVIKQINKLIFIGRIHTTLSKLKTFTMHKARNEA
jgi:hypothetical protein